MSIINDPDNLDRFTVIINTVDQVISIRDVGKEKTKVSSDGNTIGNNRFYSTFFGGGIKPGDILAIISSPDKIKRIMGHYTVMTTNTKCLIVDRDIPASLSANLTYKVFEPVIKTDGPKLSDGVTLKCIYSFCKEEWITSNSEIGNAEDLFEYPFPFLAITQEQMVMGGVNGNVSSSWSFSDTSRKLIRDGGWLEKDEKDNILYAYKGVKTIGYIGPNTQVYYDFIDEEGECVTRGKFSRKGQMTSSPA